MFVSGDVLRQHDFTQYGERIHPLRTAAAMNRSFLTWRFAVADLLTALTTLFPNDYERYNIECGLSS